ncbi:hypothetical protein DIZ76_010664 [Coccidioides immitis]|nr:hypothetical protein DIZ76_010664 [Coccidioides immitis]
MFLDDRVAASLQQSSKAARFNIHTLKRLQKAVAADPEIDLTSYFPKDYSRRLSEMRTPLLPPTITPISAATTSESTEEDIRVFLRPSEPTAIIFPLADSVRSLLEDADMSEALVGLMRRCEILWKSPFPRKKMVFKCDGNIVVKAIKDGLDYTEYTTLQYLEVHKPSVPAPRPSGLLRMNDVSLIFMTYTSTTTLAAIWAGLDISQKRSIQDQLNQILADLKSLPHPTGIFCSPLCPLLFSQSLSTGSDTPVFIRKQLGRLKGIQLSSERRSRGHQAMVHLGRNRLF